MKSGIKIKDIEIGNGQEAKEDDWALVEVYFFLNKGDEVGNRQVDVSDIARL